MADVSASTLPPTVFPSTDTTTSPACTPPTAAGPGLPSTGFSPWICTWLASGTPTKVNSAHNNTKAIRKCMAEPATATSSREWNGFSR